MLPISKLQLNAISLLLPLIENSDMKFKIGAVLTKGNQVVSYAVNSQGLSQVNPLTGYSQKVSSLHAETKCLFQSEMPLGTKYCLLRS